MLSKNLDFDELACSFIRNREKLQIQPFAPIFIIKDALVASISAIHTILLLSIRVYHALPQSALSAL